jgi:type I restriction enzyme M protein
LPLEMAGRGSGAMANERATEDIVRDHLKANSALGQRVEEQSSSVPAIKKALAAASKSGSGVGKPEFIITFPVAAPKLVMVVECKADPAKHPESSIEQTSGLCS